MILLAQPFGYASKGHITITLKKLTLYRRHDQADQDFSMKNLGILLTDTDSQAKLETYLRSSKCPLQDKDLRVFSFDSPQVSTDAVITAHMWRGSIHHSRAGRLPDMVY